MLVISVILISIIGTISLMHIVTIIHYMSKYKWYMCYHMYFRDIMFLLSAKNFNIAYESTKKHPLLGMGKCYFDLNSVSTLKQITTFKKSNTLYINFYKKGKHTNFEIFKGIDVLLLLTVYIFNKRCKNIKVEKMEHDDVKELVISRMMETKRVKKIEEILS